MRPEEDVLGAFFVCGALDFLPRKWIDGFFICPLFCHSIWLGEVQPYIQALKYRRRKRGLGNET